MKLTRAEWDHRYAQGRLRMAFIGMSNIGKSYSGMRLAAAYDFTLIEVDQLIWEALGEADMGAFAQWLGQPYSDGYAEREAESMALESEATAKAMRRPVRNPLLDTTGSVIYSEKRVLERLCDYYYVVYIEAAEEHLERLKQLYFASPKPLAWQGHYARGDGLTERESLIASYPKLLASRHAAYARLADRTISSRDILVESDAALLDLVKPAR